MYRRHVVAGLAGTITLAIGSLVLGVRPSRSQSADMLDELTLFVPSAVGGGWDRSARAAEISLTDSGLVRRTGIIYLPDSVADGIDIFAERYDGRADVLMMTGLGMMGSAMLGRSTHSLMDLAPVARLTTEPLAVAVPPDSSFRGLSDIVAALRWQPDATTFIGAHIGNLDHVLTAMIARLAGIRGDEVQYRARVGGGVSFDTRLEGRETVFVGSLGSLEPAIALGRLRPIAVSTTQRLPGVRIPTCSEQGFDINLANWRGVFAAPDIGDESLSALRRLIDAMVASPTWKAKLFEHNWASCYLEGPAFGDFVRTENARIRATLAELGLI